MRLCSPRWWVEDEAVFTQVEETGGWRMRLCPPRWRMRLEDEAVSTQVEDEDEAEAVSTRVEGGG